MIDAEAIRRSFLDLAYFVAVGVVAAVVVWIFRRR